LTKTDKPKAVELAAVVAATEVELKNHPCALPQPYSTSAGKKTGIAELRALLATGLRL
jgi:GTP-binding protein